jgi:hypothetical protein
LRVPEGRQQVPLVHLVEPTVPQLPQLLASLLVFVQVPLQQVRPVPHEVPLTTLVPVQNPAWHAYV